MSLSKLFIALLRSPSQVTNFMKSPNSSPISIAPTTNINPANNIPPAISNIVDIIKHSPELAKSAVLEMAKGLPTGMKNQLIKELVNLTNGD
jgi:hypothetical protein